MGLFGFFKELKEISKVVDDNRNKREALRDCVLAVGDPDYKRDMRNPYAENYNNEIEKFNLKEIDETFINNFKRDLEKEVDYFKFINPSGIRQVPESYIIFDLETTGLEPHVEGITEIAAIKFNQDEPVEYFHTYVNPEKHIPKKVTELTGISDDMVVSAPKIDYVLPNFIEFIDKYTLVAHNSKFDMSFILDKMYNLGYKKIKNKAFDTLPLARRYIKDVDDKKLPNYKLETLKDELCLDFDIASHNALSDVKTTFIVLQECKFEIDLEQNN